MYKKVETKLDFVAGELEVMRFWKENKIFEQTMDKNRGRKVFSFYEGPPTANGKPHIGHPLTRAMKDVIPRFKTMQGYFVPRKAGWDTHGLPVEVEVEKAKIRDDCFEDLSDICGAICPTTNEKESSWEDGARDYFKAILIAMLEDSENDRYATPVHYL